MPDLNARLAEEQDIDPIIALMQLSIAENMKAYLTPDEIETAKLSMGVDRTLIKDQTYFVIETIKEGKTVMIGCGGWGKRKTLYGGDHSQGRDDRLCDPKKDAARIRAMYTHPQWTRCGVGTLLLDLGESAARDAGFSSIELGSTIPGEPLYLARGYVEFGRDVNHHKNGKVDTVIKMRKSLINDL